MKYLLILPFLLLTQLVTAQSGKHDSHLIPPQYFLDGVPVKKLHHFDPDKIESVNIKDGSIFDEATQTKGKIYITTKIPRDFNFLTLDEIAAKFSTKPPPFIYIVDNKVVSDIQDVKIDSAYVLRCTVQETKDMPHLRDQPSMTIINILLRTKANLEEENTIRIRGAGVPYLKDEGVGFSVHVIASATKQSYLKNKFAHVISISLL